MSDVLPLVFTRAEALAAGHGARAIDAHVRSGEWNALRRGRATEQDVVVSHESAALVHRLTTFTRYEGLPVLTRCRELRAARLTALPLRRWWRTYRRITGRRCWRRR